ncbi:anti-sigma regulatory factor [Ornithinibacillus bavariensis]|nr:anti-sigma regulatory factor [Ornithinibacillus bavariensis]HAM81505.1 ATP-binding protein [Ornithinibacillus sp.]
MNSQSCVTILKEWDIVAARQMGREIAKNIGFGTVDQARITTAISELARNIYLYAGEGKISFNIVQSLDTKGISIKAEDKGPGIKDLSQVMEDGFSTSGGLGAGLPGVRRLMDDFDIISEVNKGTTIVTVKWLR